MTSTLYAQLPPELDAYIENARREWDVPGLAVTVVKDGKLLAAKGYGVRSLGKPELVDENTVFDTASLSKSFTAAAIASLVDEGKMSWDDPVRKHLPSFELRDPYRTQNATIRDLLAHRLGVEAGNWSFVFADFDSAEVLGRMKYLRDRQPFRGGQMVYSNVGYAAAGEAAAAAAGVPYVELIRKRLVEPLGMRDSTVGVQHDVSANHADGHSFIDTKQTPIRANKAMSVLPANAVNSTAKDMARWLLFQLGDGMWEGKRILSAAAMQEMHEPQMIIPTTKEMRAGRGVHFFGAYALGWQVMDFRGHKMFWHSGNANGMPVYMALLPEQNIGLCVMINTWGAPFLHGALATRILDTLLGNPLVDSAGEGLKAQLASVERSLKEREEMEKARVRDAKPSRPLEDYAGTYNDELHGAMVIRHTDGKLTLQFAKGNSGDLEHWHYDTFRIRWHDRVYEWADTFVVFALDAQGKPKSFEMRLNRDTIEAKR
ncbi:MAG TPA: serine hydrolase [Thermoanaerobaculia bacterium]|nr:serine hydrolase [Thermoanaerobaculia bacterium]